MIEQHNKSMHFVVAGAGKFYPSTAEHNYSLRNHTWDTALNCNTSLLVLRKHERISSNSAPQKKNYQALGKTDTQGEIKQLKYIAYPINN